MEIVLPDRRLLHQVFKHLAAERSLTFRISPSSMPCRIEGHAVRANHNGRCAISCGREDMKTLAITFFFSSLLALAGCGGSVSVTVGWGSVIPQFIFWEGNSSGTGVIDGNGHVFAFFADNGCLYNFHTGRENLAFCLIPGSDVVAYGAFRGQVVNVVSASGSCVAALVDSLTGNFSDIELDAYGRETVLSTQLHPALCAP